MRLSGDDYCYGAEVRQRGFFQAQVYSYLGDPPYHGDRYSLTLVSGLASVAGPWTSAALPGLSLSLWSATIAWAMLLLTGKEKIPHASRVALFAGVAVVFLTAYQAPDRVESVYWRSGSIPYMVPLIFFWLNLGLMLKGAAGSALRRWMLVAIFILAILAAGFSEVGAVTQIGWFLTAGCVAALGPIPGSARRRFLQATAVGIAGAVLGLLAMAFSPFTGRTFDLAQSSFGWDNVAVQAVSVSLSFLRETVEGLPTPTAVTLLLGVAFGTAVGTQGDPARIRRWAPAAVIVIGSGLLVGPALAMAPSLVANGYLPNPRALLPARHGMVIAFAASGVLLGQLLGSLGTKPEAVRRSLLLVSLLSIGLLSVYPLMAVSKITQGAAAYREWAAAWDARDSQIREAARNGSEVIEVTQIGSLIRWVSDFDKDPGNWYNRCAAKYYDVESLVAR